ncbi:MAG TPA: PKD domain-containing protein [Gemmatimonadales bacterium]|jgi:PKD repeat protein|nr:PKD domain-containing protein [Gemmatimonadales bacterium]
MYPEPSLRRHVRRPTAAVTALALLLTFCGDPSGAGSSAGHTPQAGFTATCTALTCSFTDGSSDADGTIVSRSWDFGDGSTSAEVNPVHTYAQTGIYSASLRVVDDSGATSSSLRGVVVGDAGFVLIGAGDIADCSSGPQTTAAIVAQYPTAAVFTLGDNAYENGSPANYSQCYDPTWGKFKDRTRPAPGNHDYNTSGAAGYFGYFGASAGPAGRGYYSYDLGSWHIISLDSEIDATATGAQAAWLKQDLADHPAACTLAYWHKPLFTSGVNHGPELAMRPLFTILYDAGVEVVLSGHNHQYERFAPQSPDGTQDDSSGIREFVAGTGGAGLYAFTTPQPNSEVRYQGYGVLKLTLGATNYAWEFVPVSGSSFTDSGTGACH